MGAAMPRVLPATYVYMDKVMDIERTMRTALQVRSCLRSFGASQCFNPPSKRAVFQFAVAHLLSIEPSVITS